MLVFATSNSATPPPGYRKWDAAERDRVKALLAETEAATAHSKPGATATGRAKADNYGWDQIMAAVMDPARLRSVAKDGRP